MTKTKNVARVSEQKVVNKDLPVSEELVVAYLIVTFQDVTGESVIAGKDNLQLELDTLIDEEPSFLETLYKYSESDDVKQHIKRLTRESMRAKKPATAKKSAVKSGVKSESK